jgi:peptidoglycan/LPS O-acetylase OafA/YrhL
VPTPAPPSIPGPRAGFRPDIEGLRAIAILLVVLYHAGVKQLPGGYVGVDVFFVISGFIITSHLLRESVSTGRLKVGAFYARRAMRLLPAATLVIAATLAAGWYWLPATRLKSLTWDAIAANGYVLNYRLADLGTDYRNATAAPSALQHFWSLGVEEQFYLVVPVLVLITAVVMRSRAAFTGAIALITAASLAWSIHSTGPSPIWAYFGAPARAWELGAGALLATLVAGAHRETLERIPLPVAVAVRWAGLAAIAVAACRFNETTPFPGYHAMLPVAGAVAVLAAGCVSPGVTLGYPVFLAIGARSYSWYLWHWPVLLIAPFALHRELGLTGKLVAVGFAFLLAALSFALVEQPIRDHPLMRARPPVAAMVAAGLTAGVVALALILPILPPRTPLGIGSVADVSLGEGSARTLSLARQVKAATKVSNLPANLRPSLKSAARDNPVIYRDGCHLDVAPTTTPRHCENFGDTHSKTLVALFGDSHAAQWFPAMNAIAKKRHWRLAVYTKGACSAANVEIYLPAVKRAYTECVAWRNRTFTRIHQLHPAIVVTSSNADGGDALGVKGGQDAAWTEAWRVTTRRLSRSGTQVVYINDTPWPKGNVPDCLAEHVRDIQDCAEKTSAAIGKARRPMMSKAVARLGATVVDPMPWFCSLSSCPVVLGNLLVYMDDSHMTTRYAALLSPLLSEKLKKPSR